MLKLRATVHTITHYASEQLVFGRDSILNTRHEANWLLIKKRKQDLINKGEKIAIKKNTRITKGTKSYLKMSGKQNSTKMYTWDPT